MIERRSGRMHADVAALDQVHQLLRDFWTAVEADGGWDLDVGWRAEFDSAVAEIAANVMRHAYRDGAGPMELILTLRGERVAGRIADQGVPFVDAPVAGYDLDAIDDLPEGGFGLGLARAGVDRLGYRRTSSGVNCWLLVKRVPPEAAASA